MKQPSIDTEAATSLTAAASLSGLSVLKLVFFFVDALAK
jgi:hypothetical protein